MHSPQICVLGSGVLVEVNNHEYIDFVESCCILFFTKKGKFIPKNEAFAVWVVKETLKQSRSFQALLHYREKTLLQGCAKHGCLNILIFSVELDVMFRRHRSNQIWFVNFGISVLRGTRVSSYC